MLCRMVIERPSTTDAFPSSRAPSTQKKRTPANARVGIGDAICMISKNKDILNLYNLDVPSAVNHDERTATQTARNEAERVRRRILAWVGPTHVA